MKPASTATLVSALRVLSLEMVSMDGVANAVVAEAAERMQALVELTARQAVQIERLEEWKQSALEVEREWHANAIATMLGGKPGESQRKVIQREVPKLLGRIKRLEEAGDILSLVAEAADSDIRQHLQVANYNLHGLMNTGEKIEPPNPPLTIHQGGIDQSTKVCEHIQIARCGWKDAKENKP